MSIRARFLIIIGLLSLVAIILVGVASYRFSLVSRAVNGVF